MDAFAVSIRLGSKGNTRGLDLKAGLFFGSFQAQMPFIGYLGGKGVLGRVEAYAHWIAFGLRACLIIGVTTFIFSWMGAVIGKSSGAWLESKAEIFGGVVLILIGIKLLVY
jgi:putative Mn2+ efflux pump MntP